MTEVVCIDRDLLGTEKHLIIDEGYRWEAVLPTTAWHLSGQPKLHSDRCLDSLLRLNCAEFDVSPPEKFVTSMALVMSGSTQQVPWSQVMPRRDHLEFTKKLVNLATQSAASLSKNYHDNTWVPQAHILRSLKPAKILKSQYESVLADSGLNFKMIETFKPGPGGWASPVSYDRFGTRTGRLTVTDGPRILTLKKDYRPMVTSSYPGGRVVSLDFSALEVRVLLYESGGRCDESDIYTHISREAFGGTADRKAVKVAVISELYGSGRHTLGEHLGIHGQELDDFVGRVKQFFKTSILKKRVKDEFLKTGRISNHYGRILMVEEPHDRIFVNTYAQSTGVDVSLLGFSQVLRQLEPLKGIRPLFVIHDELVLDASPEGIKRLQDVTSVTVPGYQHGFPLKFSEFC